MCYNSDGFDRFEGACGFDARFRIGWNGSMYFCPFILSMILMAFRFIRIQDENCRPMIYQWRTQSAKYDHEFHKTTNAQGENNE
jgi:hypothetical protein